MRFQAVELVKKRPDGTPLFRDITISLADREIVVVTGPSGVGKTTLLKAIAQLTCLDSGRLYLNDRSPDQLGIPTWRTRVMYVPQRPATMGGTPHEFHQRVQQYAANQKNRDGHIDPVTLGTRWNVDKQLWHKDWNQLSGGEAQRISLAIAISFRPDVLLVDEPTSALDPQTTLLVEESLKEHACLWVTHDPEQEKRVATRILRLNRTPDDTDGSAADDASTVIEVEA